MEKALLPKLWKILKSGGFGCAETIYPHFLPLLSKLNRDVLGEKVLPFYSNFFEHLNTGLRARLAYQANSRSDITAIATAYYECLQYILIQVQGYPSEAFNDSMSLNQFALNLLQTHIIDVISYLLSNAGLNNGKYVVIRMVDLIQFWSQNRSSNQVYDVLLLRFWDDLYSTIEQSFGKTDGDLQLRPKLELIHEMVQSLRSKSSDASKAKSSKVKFSIDNENAANDQVSTKKVANDSATFFKDEINELVVKLCRFYMKKTSDSVSNHFIRPLEQLLCEFGKTGQFFEQLCGSAADIAKLYDKFASWLLLKEIRSENVLDITLMLYAHLDQNEKSKLLNKLVKFPNENVKNWTLSRLLSHPLCTESEVLRLLSQPIVTAQIIKNAQELTLGNANEAINLMHKCFFQTENGDILIDNQTCETIIETLCSALIDKNVDEGVLDTCVSFLSQVMPVICGDEQKGKIRDHMFVKLFELCVNKQRLAMLNEDTLWEAVTSWQDALSSNDIQLTDKLLEICSDIIKESLNSAIEDQTITLNHIESVSEILSKLILCSIERFDDDDEQKYHNADKIIASVFGKIQAQYNEFLSGCHQTCTFVELLNGYMTAVPSVLPHLVNDLGALDVYKNANALLKLATFKFRVIFKITCAVPKSRISSESENENDEIVAEQPFDEEHTEDFCDLNESLLKKWSDNIYNEIFAAISIGGLLNSFLDNFNVSFMRIIKYHENTLSNESICLLLIFQLSSAFEEFILHFQESIRLFLTHIAEEKVDIIVKYWINTERLDDPFAVNSTLLLQEIGPYKSRENCLVLLHNDLTKVCNGTENLQQNINILLTYTRKLSPRQLSISANILGNSVKSHFKAISLRCLLKNYFTSESNEIGDQQIVNECMNLIDELYVQSKSNKAFLLYNE